MRSLTGAATCREFSGEGFDFMLPQHCPGLVLRCFDALAETVVAPVWLAEIELLVARRVSVGGSPRTTREDVDLGFSALADRVVTTPRPWRLLRGPGFTYDVPGNCSTEVRRHFHEQFRHFMNTWAAEVEQLAGRAYPRHRRITVVLALNAATWKIIERRPAFQRSSNSPAFTAVRNAAHSSRE